MSKKTFDPEKYGMVVCPSCHGHGFIEGNASRNACPKCGGFGCIKKEQDSEQDDND